MKCQEIQHWLLSARADAPLPVTIRNHLLLCGDCRRQQEVLKRLDDEVRHLPVPPASASAKQRLWERIDSIGSPSPLRGERGWGEGGHLGSASPFPPSPPTRLPPRGEESKARPSPPTLLSLWGEGRMSPRWRAAALAAAAVLLLAVGLWIGRQFAPRTELAQQDNGGPAAKAPLLALRVAQHNARLAAIVEPREQVEELNLLAADLEAEAVRLARLGALDELPRLAECYQCVVQNGIVRRALLQLPAGEKEKVVPALVQRLRKTEGDMQALTATSLPLISQRLLPLERAASAAAQQLETGMPPPVLPFGEGYPAGAPAWAPLTRLALELADQPDPLSRADLSAQVAEILANATVTLAATGDAKQAQEMGSCLGQVLETGVAANLDQAQKKKDNTAEFQAAAAKIRQQSTQAVSVLEKNLAAAPPAAKAGLQQALEAASHGRDVILQRGGPEQPGLVPPN